MKIPFISNLKKPACASKQDVLELATLGYVLSCCPAKSEVVLWFSQGGITVRGVGTTDVYSAYQKVKDYSRIELSPYPCVAICISADDYILLYNLISVYNSPWLPKLAQS